MIKEGPQAAKPQFRERLAHMESSKLKKKARKIIKRGDWVIIKGCTCGMIGYVKRVARDGSWADIEWGESNGKIRPELADLHVKKRLDTNDLIVVTTIDLCPTN
jgi:preprotein translocase subunit YajC